MDEAPQTDVKQPRAVKTAGRDKKEQPKHELEAEEKKLAKLSQTNKKRKRLLERIEKVSL